MSVDFGDVVSKLDDSQILTIIAGYALASHLYFKNYEPSLASSFWFAVASSVSFVATLVGWTSRTSFQVFSLYIQASTLYLVTLFFSIGLYRVYFHPLRKIPGPPGAKLTKWWAMASAFKGKLGYDTDDAHRRYGPVVRIGPNHVDFQNPAVVPQIYGANPAQLRKDDFGLGPQYDTLQHQKDDGEHAARRKLWNQGFSTKSITEYETDIQHRIAELLAGISKEAAESPERLVDMEMWSAFFSFDIMGDLGFGEGFNMLANGKSHRFLEILKKTMAIAPPFSQVSWITPLKHLLPPAPEEKEFNDFTKAQVRKRMTMPKGRRDLYTHLLNEEGNHTLVHNQIQLDSDAILIIVAGSDTTSSVLTWAWYYLCATRNRHYYVLLQQEFDRAAEEGELDPTRLSKLPLLNAVINETMRLQPPVPGGLQRLAPKGGIVLDGVFIPEGTTVSCGAITIQRDPANWAPEPNAFRPERWIDSEKEIAANKAAFIPFSFGPRGCPGKALALLECRLVLSNIITRYDAKLKPGFDCAAFEAGVRDCFTIQSESLFLVMDKRVKK